MAIEKYTGYQLTEVQDFITEYSLKTSTWTPAVTAAQSMQDANLSLVFDNTKKTLTVYYLVDHDGDGTATLFSQAFNKTGAATGKPSKLITNIYSPTNSDVKTKSFYELEKSLGLDLDGDSLVGSSIVLQEAGVKTLKNTDLSPLDGNSDYFSTLGLSANGKAGTILNITTVAGNGLDDKPIVIGALSVDSSDDVALAADALMSNYQIGFPSITAGFGTGKQGTVNVNAAEIYSIGGLISTFLINALNLDGEYQNLVIGGLGAGFGPRAKGTINVTDSDLYFHRNLVPTDVTSTDYDVMLSWLNVGGGGGNGEINITRSKLELKGTDNNIAVANDAGAVGRLKLIDSDLIMDAQYSENDDPSSNNDLASSDANIGCGKSAKGTMSLTNSLLVVDGNSANIDVGREGGTGTLTLNSSQVQQIARRSDVPLTRDNNPITFEEYENEWSGSYLRIGYDAEDGNARTNLATSGTASFTNDSLYVIRGPHAGIEVGGSGTNAKGSLTIDASAVEVVGSGAIQLPGTDGTNVDDYLSAGRNNSGSLNTDYFTFVNIGGSSWQDFGGTGSIIVKNGSSLKVAGFDITSNDVDLSANDANLSVGGWGTKASLIVDGDSQVQVAGTVSLGLRNDLSSTIYNQSNGLYNVSNYSMVNVQSGGLEAFSYQSQIHAQGNGSPLAKYAMYTVLGTLGTITANEFYFNQNSQIIGKGTLTLDDVFSNQIMELHEDVSTAATEYSLSEENTAGVMQMSRTKIYVGDTFNFDGLKKTTGYGTLTIESNLDNDTTSSITILDSTLAFDLSKTQSDKLIISGFDQINFDRNTFEITGNKVNKGQSFVLIDLQMDSAPSAADLENMSNTVKLVGVKGTLSYDADASDFIFTVT